MIRDMLYEIKWFIQDWTYYKPKNYASMVYNFFYWGWKLRNNWDWDGGYMLKIMLLKMKKIQEHLYKHGHSVDSENPTSDMHKALRVLIRLCERLIERDPIVYSMRAWEAFDEKWGKLETWTTPSDTPKCSRWHSKRAKVTEENKEQCKKEQKELYKYQSELYHRDRRLFFQIMEKYIDEIWD